MNERAYKKGLSDWALQNKDVIKSIGQGLNALQLGKEYVNQQWTAGRDRDEVAAEMGYAQYLKDKEKTDNLTGASSAYNTSLSKLLKDPATEMKKNPFFKWETQQGENAVNRAAAANGQLGSGNRMTALSDYAQNQSGKQFFTLADMYAKLKQADASNYQAMSGINNQKYGIDAQSASDANRLAFQKTQFGYLQDQNAQADQFAQQGWADAQKQNRMAQYGGLTSDGWAEKARGFQNLADSSSGAAREGYLQQYNNANAMARSAPNMF